MSATWISCPWACWAVFVSALLQLNHWVDPRGFHHPNADYGLSFQLWATAAALIQKEDKIWVEQTLLWAELPPSWKMVRHTSVWRHFNKKRCIFERRKGTLKKKYCNLEKYIKLIMSIHVMDGNGQKKWANKACNGRGGRLLGSSFEEVLLVYYAP